MKYKVGDKFVIEISEKYTNDADAFVIENEILYRVKGFKSLVFDSYGLDKLQKYGEIKETLELLTEAKQDDYNKGLNDAWELAKKIFALKGKEFDDVFGYVEFSDVFHYNTPQQALAKLEAYEKGQEEIKVGDVVYADDEPDSFGVVTYMDSERLYITWDDGSSGKEFDWSDIHKTGRHIDIEHLLEQIRGNE